jgi:hypothetical protein
MKIRITKKHWQAMGGLENPKLSRRQLRNGAWSYFRTV